MKFLHLLFSLTFTAMSTTSFAQDLSIHQWENRLVLIFSNNLNNADFKKQIAELQTDEEGLRERKILVYQVLPTQFQQGLKPEDNWQKGSRLYTKYRQNEANFEVQLIGLDGGKKRVQTDILTTEKLFSMIDKMPMRQAELRRGNH
jgi:V8-like Glu-specific endopeptidase